MAKKNKTKNVKKDAKTKNKNININIHIDQSKKTTGSNPKKSNIKTLPAFSAAPLSGGNYVRQFNQDPYYTQSQYEHMNLLKNYNNALKQNNQMITGFKDNNRNDQKLIQNMNGSTINREYKIDDDSHIFDDETTQEKLIEYEMNDDPRTNKEPENMILRKDTFQQLPYNDLNTKDELLMFNKTNIPYKQIKDVPENMSGTPKEEPKSETKSLTSSASKKFTPRSLDNIELAMRSDDIFYNGKKIFRNTDLKEGKIWSKTTGLFVDLNNDDYKNSVAKGTEHIYYTNNPYEINKTIQSFNENDPGYNQNWARYKQVKKKDLKAKKTIPRPQDEFSDSEDDKFQDTNLGSKMENSLSRILPPLPPITKNEDDNASMSSRISSMFSPKKLEAIPIPPPETRSAKYKKQEKPVEKTGTRRTISLGKNKT